MAITATSRGTGGNATGATTFTLSPASNLAAGSMAVLSVSADNSNTNGAAHSTFTATDTHGNTWTRQISPLYDPGTANEGVEGAIFTTPMDGGTLTTGSTITVTFGTSTTAKAWTLLEVVPDTSNTLSYVAGGVNTGAATTTPTVTTSSITSGNIVIGSLFTERGGQTFSADADSSNGSWSSLISGSASAGSTGQSCATQYKVTTGTGTQTFNPTQTGVSSDVILGWIELKQTASGGGSTTAKNLLLLGVG